VGVLTAHENGENRDPQDSNSTQERPADENNDAESFQSILTLTGFILFKNQTKNGIILCLIFRNLSTYGSS
jgi:hypothetical protein